MTRLKSSEQVSAEAALFADSLPPAYREMGFKALTRGARFSNGTLTCTVDYMPQEPYEHVVEESDYVNFLRSQSPRQRRAFGQIAANYPEFREEFYKIKVDPDRKNDLVGAGSTSAVYKFLRDGKAYALRVPHGRYIPPADTVHKHVSASIATQDLHSFETIIAASYTDGVTIAPFFPGQMIDHPYKQTPEIKTEHIKQLKADLLAADDREVVLDVNTENLLYDSDYGFLIIDHSHIPEYRRGGIQMSKPSDFFTWLQDTERIPRQ